jgi:hypothetical protein
MTTSAQPATATAQAGLQAILPVPLQGDLPGMRRQKPEPKVNGRTFWTTPEVAILRAHYSQLGAPGLRAQLPRRSDASIYNKANELGLAQPPKKPRRLNSYPHCPLIDAEITSAYLAGLRRGEVQKLAERYDRPRWWIKRRAGELGMATQRIMPPDWTDAELDILQDYAHLTLPAICRRLRRAGYQRSVNAIAIKIQRSGYDRTDPDHWSARQLAGLFGVTPWVVGRWIDDNGLPAKRRGTQRTEAQGGDQYWIARAPLRRWIADKAQLIDLRRVDKFWFFDLVFGPAR